MKKITTILAVIGMIIVSSCTGPEGPPGYDGIDGHDGLTAEAFEIKNVNLTRISNNKYELRRNFNTYIKGDLYDDETVLIYRLTDMINSSTPVWQLIPRTTYFDNGDVVDYFFDFSKIDFIITARASFNLAEEPGFIINQTFRVVTVPSNLVGSLNKNNYLEVMSALNLKESQVKNVNF